MAGLLPHNTKFSGRRLKALNPRSNLWGGGVESKGGAVV